MLTTSIPSTREAVVQLPVSTSQAPHRPTTQQTQDTNLVVRKPAPDATQAAVLVDYTVVRFNY